MQITEVVKPTNGVKKQLKKVPQTVDRKKVGKGSKRARSESDSSDSKDSLTEDEENEESRPKKKPTEKAKTNTKGPKILKKSKDGNNSSSSSDRKNVEQESNSEDSSGNSSEDDNCHSSKGDAKVLPHNVPLRFRI